MSLGLWCMIYLGYSLLYKWIISWGGAKILEGWKSIVILDWLAGELNREQLRFYALLLWIVFSIWFVFGIFMPEVRFLPKHL